MANLIFTPIIGYILNRKSSKHHEWVGNFSSWEEATNNTQGYNSEVIIQRVYNAASAVKNQQAVYERDSVIFNKVEHNWPLLSFFLKTIIENRTNVLRVLDFGGALGTTYFAIRKFIPSHIQLTWIIVEQKEFVTLGRKEFESKELKFYYDIKSVFASNVVDLVILSGVIQYLENPWLFISDLYSYSFKSLLFDRTFFIHGLDRRIVIQNVPPVVYNGSYPCWLFNESEFIRNVEMRGSKLKVDFDSQYDGESLSTDNKRIYYKGFYFEKND